MKPVQAPSPAPPAFPKLECDCDLDAYRRKFSIPYAWAFWMAAKLVVLIFAINLGALLTKFTFSLELVMILLPTLVVLVPSIYILITGFLILPFIWMKWRRHLTLRRADRLLKQGQDDAAYDLRRSLGVRVCLRHQFEHLARRFKVPISVLAICARKMFLVPRTTEGLRSISYTVFQKLDALCEHGDELSALECFARGYEVMARYPILDTAVMAVHEDDGWQRITNYLNLFTRDGVVGGYRLPTR